MNSDELDTEALQLFDRKAICDEMPEVNDQAARALLRLFEWQLEHGSNDNACMFHRNADRTFTRVFCKPGTGGQVYNWSSDLYPVKNWNDVPGHVVLALYHEAVRRGVL